MTAERLALSTTSVISRTIASMRLFRTDIRKGSIRRWPAGTVSSVMSGHLNQKISEPVHARRVLAFQHGGKGFRLDQAWAVDGGVPAQLRAVIDRNRLQAAGFLDKQR